MFSITVHGVQDKGNRHQLAEIASMRRSTAEVAEQIGVSKATVKNWLTAHGSMIGATKAANNRWQYNETVIGRLAQIHQAVRLGYSHAEISHLIATGEIDNLALTPMATIKTGEIAALLQPLDVAISDLRAEQEQIKALLAAILAHLEPPEAPLMLEQPDKSGQIAATTDDLNGQKPARWWRRKAGKG